MKPALLFDLDETLMIEEADAAIFEHALERLGVERGDVEIATLSELPDTLGK